MITYKNGNILDETAQALVNPVNCFGVMGAGLAKEFKAASPKNFQAYEVACATKQVAIGRVFVFPDYNEETKTLRYIINFPTKNHWSGHSYTSYIKLGLESLVNEIRAHEITSIAIPALGCGLGGLQWEAVRPLIADALERLPDVQTTILNPLEKSHD